MNVKKSGGEAWLVDLSHPDICPECGGQQMNADEKVIGSLSISCTECLQNNFPYPGKWKKLEKSLMLQFGFNVVNR